MNLSEKFDDVINLSWHILTRLNQSDISMPDIQYLYSIRGKKIDQITDILEDTSCGVSRKRGDFTSILDRLSILTDLDTKILHKLHTRRDTVEQELGYLYSDYRNEDSYRAGDRAAESLTTTLRILG
ncbi:MAG: hypothetical protein EA364_09060 [Balneolaceae bacterium]|nr:MAG: hypothetical protein EA364_09060 [Balneolaceae bacterium]